MKVFNVMMDLLQHRLTERRLEVRLAGSGGQGIIKSGLILAEAAMMDGKNVVQLQNYGAEARNGASRSDVIISDDEIDYPGIVALDILLAMNQKAYNSYTNILKPDGVVIFDSDLIYPALIEGINQYSAPFTRIASSLGSRIYANTVALGYLVAITGVVSMDSVKKAMKKHLPKKSLDVNLKAIERGYRLGCTK